VRTIATVLADLRVTPLQTASRLSMEVGGRSLLRYTVERVEQAGRVEEIIVLCPNPQQAEVQALLEGTKARVRPFDAPEPPWLPLVRAGRKWSLDGWRGGLGGSSSFDEYTHPHLLSALLKSVPAEYVLSIPPAAPLLVPSLLDELVAHGEAHPEEIRIAFTQAPPGVAGVLYRADLLHELAEKNTPPGWMLSYKPDSPAKDLIFQPCCLDIPVELRYATGRLIADTDRATHRVLTLLDRSSVSSHGTGDRAAEDAAGESAADAAHLGTLLTAYEAEHLDTLPCEVEIEFTTDTPYPSSVLHPWGDRLTRRGEMDGELLRRLAAELARRDDQLVLVGGCGDPLRHPNFGAFILTLTQALRGSVRAASVPAPAPTALGVPRSGTQAVSSMPTPGTSGVAVRTTAVDLGDPQIGAMLDAQVDVLMVVLDAWSPETYAALHTPVLAADPSAPSAASSHPTSSNAASPADLNAVLTRLEAYQQAQRNRGAVRPILHPEFTKAKQNVHELDAFYDGWLRRCGTAQLTGVSHYAQQVPNHAVISMAPASRGPCRRLRTRCLILADGRVTLCDQDYRGAHVLGDLHDQSLAEIWTSDEAQAVRELHARGNWAQHSLCSACEEWHRP
jgi:radical SAM protein with 4Fe4S-binding SPASM domain